MSKSAAIITGSGGLVGIESVLFFRQHFDIVIGIDNDSRGYFFGDGGSVLKNIQKLQKEVENYRHYFVDIRDRSRLQKVFASADYEIKLIINAAAQPSHDWSGRFPLEDFEINATGALNVLECMRNNCPQAVFIQLSSSKVYGDNMNSYEFLESNTRYDLVDNHKYKIETAKRYYYLVYKNTLNTQKQEVVNKSNNILSVA